MVLVNHKIGRRFDVRNVYELIEKLGISKKEAKEHIDPHDHYKTLEDAVKENEAMFGHSEVIAMLLDGIDGYWDFVEYEVDGDWEYTVWEIESE